MCVFKRIRSTYIFYFLKKDITLVKHCGFQLRVKIGDRNCGWSSLGPLDAGESKYRDYVNRVNEEPTCYAVREYSRNLFLNIEIAVGDFMMMVLNFAIFISEVMIADLVYPRVGKTKLSKSTEGSTDSVTKEQV